MEKSTKGNYKAGILSEILFAIAMLACAIAVFFWARTGEQTKELEKRVTSLEQDLQNTKEVLDAKGIEDLNL
jgi:uncharacterized membrane protein YciS (DUF1049 family)